MTTQHVFYAKLIDWNKVDEIVFLTEPASHTQVRSMIMEALDHALMTAILHELAEEYHFEFLDLCHQKFHDPIIIEWLEVRRPNISDHLSGIAAATKQELYQLVDQRS